MTAGAAESPVSLANRIIAFPVAARLAGMEDVPEPRETGTRAWCPFGEFSHSDHGRDKAMRVYPDHGYCFSEKKYFSPVGIYAEMNDLDFEEAARQLLDHVGYRPASWQQHWEEVVSAAAGPDINALAVALSVRLAARYPDWGNRQYDPVVSAALARCLGLLTRVHSEKDCATWLESADAVMSRALGG
jgi:hypothetical protein